MASGVRHVQVDEEARELAAVDRGTPRAEVCATFAVSQPTVRRWLRRRRETGDLAPTVARPRPAAKGSALWSWLPARLEASPDATLEELARAFAAEHARLGWTRKKRAS